MLFMPLTIFYFIFFTLCGSVVCAADLFMLRRSDQTCELGRDWKHGQRVQQRGLSAGHHRGAPTVVQQK